MFTGHTDVDTGSMSEEFRRVGPFVRLELPCLTSREDGDESLPVIWFEVCCAVGEDEACWSSGRCSATCTTATALAACCVSDAGLAGDDLHIQARVGC